MTIGSRTVPDADLAAIRLTPFIRETFSGLKPEKHWQVQAVTRSGQALVCASGDHDAMLDELLWAGKALSETKP
jgi:hypothetical protein